MQRVMIYDHADRPVMELSPLEVMGLQRHEQINGEHSLTIRTPTILQRGWRILTQDNRGRWREHVVYGVDHRHESGEVPIGEYYCVWSLMHDLMGTTVSRMPGVQNPVTAGEALDAALSGTSRWEVGTVTNDTLGGASMYDMSGWDALGVFVKVWGGEIDVTIEVGLTGVVSRKVDSYDAQGEQTPKRRFDIGADLKSVRRTIPDGPMFCRISPRGKGEETGSGYGRKITIESVNDGKDYIENADMVDLVKLPDGDGGYEYPTLIVENPDAETPAELLAWGLSVLDDYTEPKIGYKIDVVQAALEGVDMQGVSLGDAVHVVDGRFGNLRLTARAVSIDTDMLDEMSVKMELGHIAGNMASEFAKLRGDMDTIQTSVEAMRSGADLTDAYLDRLLTRLNQEINATGGYTYITQGQGIRTYDREVTDPLVGAEASKVVEVKGGTIRIADSKTAQGEWEWDTVFVSGHVAAQLVTAAHITSGSIGNADDSFFIDLDNRRVKMPATTIVDDRTMSDIIDAVDATITNVDVQYAQGTSATVAPESGWSTTAPAWEAGKYIWSRTATTTATGTTYSTPAMISGKDGQNGQPGAAGVGISSTEIKYGTSASAATQPTSWSATAPTSIATGSWLWTRTVTSYTDGTSTTAYSKAYVGTNGTNGQDGTSVTILGSYDTLAELEAAHPTGSLGDAYIVGGDLYVWNGTAWEDVGQIQGPRGPAGQDGTSVTVTAIEYGTSTSATAQPTSWSTTAPASLSKGTWLWVRTTYSDGGSATTKSYAGTDGEDGASVYVQSVTKVGDVTTVVIADTDGHTSTLTITDGTDGENGQPGTNGLSGYVHVAWANSADGSEDFSTTVSAGKKYLGTYTDNTAADSTRYQDYSWSLIKGQDGTNGADGSQIWTATANPTTPNYTFAISALTGGTGTPRAGDIVVRSYYRYTVTSVNTSAGTVLTGTRTSIRGASGAAGTGISAIVEEYYLSTSNTTQTGGSWSQTQPTWVEGRYIWTRSIITWDTTPATTTTTEPVLAQAINSANELATTANTTANTANATANQQAAMVRPYGDGVLVCRSGNSVGALVNADGSFDVVAVTWSGQTPSASGKYAVFGSNTRIYQNASSLNRSFIDLSSGGIALGWGRESTVVDGYRQSFIGRATEDTVVFPEDWAGSSVAYATLGSRLSQSPVGDGSTCIGQENTASGRRSTAIGYHCKATAEASVANGDTSTASAYAAHAEGYKAKATGNWSHAEGGTRVMGTDSGPGTTAAGVASHAEGVGTTAEGIAAHAEGMLATATGDYSHAEGYVTSATGQNSHAGGSNTSASYDNQTAIGKYNTDTDGPLVVGRGQAGFKRNALVLDWSGNLTITGTLTQSSDRRLKNHIAYLGDDAAEFIRSLRPALYEKDGAKHTGFYAQDVEAAEPEGWETDTVSEAKMDENAGPTKTLDYTALIAPLVAYCQQLERRIDQLENGETA